MAVLTVLAGLYLALVSGLAGDFPMLLTQGVGIGATIGGMVSFMADYRARRRPPAGPWDPPTPAATDHYVRNGGIAGFLVGLALAVLQALGA